MKICFCKLVLALIIIALLWWNPSWVKIGVTIAAAIIAVMALSGDICCCNSKKCPAEVKPEEKQ